MISLAKAVGNHFAIPDPLVATRDSCTRGNPAGAVQVPADYSELGILLITATVLCFVLPMLAILFVKSTRFRSA